MQSFSVCKMLYWVARSINELSGLVYKCPQFTQCKMCELALTPEGKCNWKPQEKHLNVWYTICQGCTILQPFSPGSVITFRETTNTFLNEICESKFMQGPKTLFSKNVSHRCKTWITTFYCKPNRILTIILWLRRSLECKTRSSNRDAGIVNRWSLYKPKISISL